MRHAMGREGDGDGQLQLQLQLAAGSSRRRCGRASARLRPRPKPLVHRAPVPLETRVASNKARSPGLSSWRLWSVVVGRGGGGGRARWALAERSGAGARSGARSGALCSGPGGSHLSTCPRPSGVWRLASGVCVYGGWRPGSGPGAWGFYLNCELLGFQ
jgi:hypothetical protein